MNLLPTEEDVLAALLVRWLMETGELHDVREEDWGVPLGVGWIAYDLCERTPDGVAATEAAIADSERRLAAERADEAVLLAAEEWRDSPTMLASEGLESAIDHLRATEGR
jgi:hypothetical protein